MATRRQVSVFIDGKQVESTLYNIYKSKRKIVSQLNHMIEGSDEYNKTLKKLDPLNKVIKKHNKRLRGVESTYDKMKVGIGKYVGIAAGAFAVTELVGYGKELFRLGAEMELLTKKAQTVFGTALPQVTREAENNAAAMGLTISQYTDASAAIGDLLIPMGFQRQEAASISTTLVDLSGALSEWTGGQKTAQEVTDILGKAILGEREQLKTLGISIQEADIKTRLQEKGLHKLTGTMLQQAKAAATLELITEKSTDAQAAFANNSDTLIRRQAELNARIETTVESLANALIPVFNRLVDVAEILAGGIEDVTSFMENLADPVAAVTSAVDEQSKVVSNLEKNLVPLLDRYDELTNKSELSKDEQTELAAIIIKVGKITPTAVSEIDKYGNALKINASASREFLEAERKRLEFVNKESITELNDVIEGLELRAKIWKDVIETGETNKGIFSSDLSPDQLRKFTQEYGDITRSIEGARLELERLQGVTSITDTDLNEEQLRIQAEKEVTIEEALELEKDKKLQVSREKRREKEAARELEQQKKHLENLANVLDGYHEEQRISELSETDQKRERIRLQYQKEIDLAKALETKGVKEATALRIELEKVRDQELNDLFIQLSNESIAKEEARIEEEYQAAETKRKEVAERRANLITELNEFAALAVEQEEQTAIQLLEEHYNELLLKAEEFEIDTLDIKISYTRQKDALIKDLQDKEIKDAEEATKKQLEGIGQAFGALSEVVTAATQLAGTEAKKQAELGKVLALIEIGVNSAKALSAATASAAKLPFPGNLLAIASAVATVLGNMAKARKLLAATPEVPQRYTGGPFNVQGQQDGKTYYANYLGRRNTGMLPSSPSLVLASERGAEYFVSHSDLQNPYVVDHVRAIENIRKFGSTTSVPQFAEGGFTDTTEVNATTPQSSSVSQVSFPPEMVAVFFELKNVLENIQENGIDAYISDDTLVNMQKRLVKIDRASGKIG